MPLEARERAWCQPSAVPAGVADSTGRSAPPHGAVDVPRRRDQGFAGPVRPAT